MMENIKICAVKHHHDAAVDAVKACMPPEEELADMAELFRVFGDSTRMKILYILREKELCVCDIAAVLGLTQPAISYQLKVLKAARLVKCRRAGKTAYYSPADDHVATMIKMAKEHLEER